jgi:hypothetical protein
MLVMFLCCAAMTGQAMGQAAPGGAFVADPGSGCKVWNPHPTAGETVSWTGECVNGLAEGRGRLQWLRGGTAIETDDGDWSHGRQSGHGKQDWKSGSYEGELLNGEPSGHGIMNLMSARYEGEFRNGKPNGIGAATTLSGVFRGTWKDGCLADGKRKVAFAVSTSTCH